MGLEGCPKYAYSFPMIPLPEAMQALSHHLAISKHYM
jgi:hypothetical protein